MSLKFGKLPATFPAGHELYTLRAVQADPLPAAPSRFGFGLWFHGAWGMLGNDQYGDCAWAGPAHETMIFTQIGAGKHAPFTTECVLADYSAVTGFNPNDPNTDVGSNMGDVMDYRRTTGVGDATGARHKIELAVRIPLYDWDTFIRCVHTFGVVAMGFEVAQSAETQFGNGQPWDDVGDRNILGGHYVPVVGSLASDKEASCITWGARQRLTRAFWEAYADELWVPLSAEVVRAGYGLNHLAWDKVEALASGLPSAR